MATKMGTAGTRQPTVTGYIKPLGYVQEDSLASATTLTPPTGQAATLIWIQAQDQNVRWRDDGTAPDADTGMILYAGDSIWYNGDITAIQFIETAASAKLNCAYYGY